MSDAAAVAELQGQKQIRLRLRRNLALVARRERGREDFVLKDPLSLRYYRLDERQRFLIGLMDGTRTLEEVRTAYERARRPERLPREELESFAAQLVNSGLVQNDTALAGPLLYEQAERERRRTRAARLRNFLSIRIPLFDPDRLLTRLLPAFGFLFKPWFLCLALGAALAAVATVAVRWADFTARLPTAEVFFTPATLLSVWLALGLIKILHELGHGLCCKAQGGEVHEMGLLLLMFFPALYCNVTDAWKLPGRRQRIAVSAAGMYVELLLATLGAFLWAASDPASPLHHFCLVVMLVCSAHTVLVNANPLMRLDGYYILADWLDVPNLSETAGHVLRSAVLRWLGAAVPEEGPPSRAMRFLLICYSAASFVYRCVVVAAGCYLLHLFLKPYKLGSLCLLLAAGSLLTVIVWPAWCAAVSVGRQRSHRNMRYSRVAWLLGVPVALALFAFLVPLPRKVEALALMQIDPAHQERVAAPEDGAFLSQLLAADGQRVERGEILAVLTNPKLEIALRLNEADQALRLHQQQAQAARLAEGRNDVSGELQACEYELASLRQQHAILKRQAERLTLRAPRSGMIVGLPSREQVGTWLEGGTEVCRVGDATALRAVLLLEPADRELIAVGNSAHVRVHGGAGNSWPGAVRAIAQAEAGTIPPQLSGHAGGEVATQKDASSGADRPREQHYLVAVQIAQAGRMLHPGALGRARIDAEPRTLWWRAQRFLADTFNWVP